MNAQISSNENKNPFLLYSYKGWHYQVPLKDILYLESNGRKCIIYTRSSKNTTPEKQSSASCFYGKISELTDLLKLYGFVRCHQSYLVNVTAKISYKNHHLFINDNVIPVSDRYRREIIDLFNNRLSAEENNEPNRPITGALVCIKGAYYGSIIRMYSEVPCSIGRDRQNSEIIINLPYISRSHCDIIFKNDYTYEITDHSHNGTYVIEEDGFARKLTPDKICRIPAGSVICFGDRELQYHLI